jgi:CBS domain-containing protein
LESVELVRRQHAIAGDHDRVAAHRKRSRGRHRRTARDAASEPTVTVRADFDLQYASEAMVRHGTTHIVVTAPGDGRPIGVLSSLDIANAVGAKQRS